MPSGITSDIYEGKDVSLRDYLMGVARQMSMAIMQRDSDPREPVKLREVQPYSKDRLDEAQAELERLESLSLEDAAREAQAELKQVEAAHISVVNDREALTRRYDDMIAKVRTWKPEPIVQYVKDHALKYLEESREFDCGHGVYPTAPVRADYEPERWLKAKIDRARRDVEYHTKQYQEEVERVAGYNLHIEAFHRSLPDE